MIHIEKDWYIRQDGYKNYTLGRLRKRTEKGKQREILIDCTYHASLCNAVITYIEISSENVLENKNIELLDAFAALRKDYDRLIQLVKERVPKTVG
ncbi:MAG: hypothetical protein IKG39_05035 [Lachnospiraceae bacterium]|nr:hypothetical protein [Lachnospiraceae bacterium]